MYHILSEQQHDLQLESVIQTNIKLARDRIILHRNSLAPDTSPTNLNAAFEQAADTTNSPDVNNTPGNPKHPPVNNQPQQANIQSIN